MRNGGETTNVPAQRPTFETVHLNRRQDVAERRPGVGISDNFPCDGAEAVDRYVIRLDDYTSIDIIDYNRDGIINEQFGDSISVETEVVPERWEVLDDEGHSHRRVPAETKDIEGKEAFVRYGELAQSLVSLFRNILPRELQSLSQRLAAGREHAFENCRADSLPPGPRWCHLRINNPEDTIVIWDRNHDGHVDYLEATLDSGTELYISGIAHAPSELEGRPLPPRRSRFAEYNYPSYGSRLHCVAFDINRGGHLNDLEPFDQFLSGIPAVQFAYASQAERHMNEAQSRIERGERYGAFANYFIDWVNVELRRADLLRNLGGPYFNAERFAQFDVQKQTAYVERHPPQVRGQGVSPSCACSAAGATMGAIAGASNGNNILTSILTLLDIL